MKTLYRYTAAAAIVMAAAAVVTIYASVDPAEAGWMPRCALKSLTGYDCPGCGSQRALHALLCGNAGEAVAINPYIFALLPVAGLYFCDWLTGGRHPRLHRALRSPVAAAITAAATVAWWVGRNL